METLNNVYFFPGSERGNRDLSDGHFVKLVLLFLSTIAWVLKLHPWQPLLFPLRMPSAHCMHQVLIFL